jgi:hypothetical protein
MILSAALGVATARADSGSDAQVFLCYSSFQLTPDTSENWTVATVSDLLSQGYWEPFAVAGTGDETIAGGDAPAFHLVCNLSASQKRTGAFVDNSGSSIPFELADTVGVYEIAG